MVEQVVKSLCTLPLLPARFLKRGFRVMSRVAERSAEWNSMRPLFQYIKRTWLNPQRRRVLSVYKSLDRTNNVSESDNNQLRIGVRTKHPNLWVFIGKVNEAHVFI